MKYLKLYETFFDNLKKFDDDISILDDKVSEIEKEQREIENNKKKLYNEYFKALYTFIKTYGEKVKSRYSYVVDVKEEDGYRIHKLYCTNAGKNTIYIEGYLDNGQEFDSKLKANEYHENFSTTLGLIMDKITEEHTDYFESFMNGDSMGFFNSEEKS